MTLQKIVKLHLRSATTFQKLWNRRNEWTAKDDVASCKTRETTAFKINEARQSEPSKMTLQKTRDTTMSCQEETENSAVIWRNSASESLQAWQKINLREDGNYHPEAFGVIPLFPNNLLAAIEFRDSEFWR